ncbi:unnamed protein product [Clonostachys chloroleuca]|uniref:TIGR00725 family protein n=1 Tax=Clonostachys chloroleuca TaxID=1926264 RepID=A0AA35LPV5_9HYPO|nr:unnamed protein product [Clonostachys chloroleuca]
MTLRWDKKNNLLHRGGKVFNPSRLEWSSTAQTTKLSGSEVTPLEALRHLAKEESLRRVPVGVIGTRTATKKQLEVSRQLGAAMADHGMQLICGGKGGVMEAACEGHAAHGGLPVGILPDGEWDAANPFCAIPIATGLGVARNAVIARASVALIAVGGGMGTLTEMAMGMQFKRLVLRLDGAPEVEGAVSLGTVEEALDRVARRLLSI